jgi:hypothetical protein
MLNHPGNIPQANTARKDSPIEERRLKEALCWYDPENPNSTVADYREDFGEEPPVPRSRGCSCDNCFYGRDALAQEALRARAEVRKLRAVYVEDDDV